MRREHFRYGSIFVVITCVFALLVSCGSSGGGDEGGPGTASITLSASPDSIPADDVSSSAITAELKDASGEPVPEETSVTFSTTLGKFPNGSTSYTVSTSDENGIVVVSLIAGTTPGVADVTVKCSGVTQLISIEFTYAGSTGVPVAEEFGLFPQFCNISGLWIAGLADQITATVGDFYGNAVQDNTLIYFKTYNTGGLLDPDIAGTSGGFASSTLYSTGSPTPLQGFVSLTAETTGGPTTRVTSLTVTPYPDNHIIYAGTNGGGVYKSTDRGANWENISRSSENPKQGQNWIDPYIKGHSAISVDPDDYNTVYAGTGYLGKGSLYRSLDGGMNWNSNNVEEWNGMNIYRSLDGGEAAVLTVLCDGDDTATDYPYVWIGTEGRGPLYAIDGENFQPSGGIVTNPVPGSGNTGNGTMSKPILSYTSKTETWTATCSVPGDASASVPVAGANQGDGYMSDVDTSGTTKNENWTVTYKGTAGQVSTGGDWQGDVSPIAPTVENPGPPPFYSNPANGGDGTMSKPTLYGGSAKNEDWTVTYVLPTASATVPVPGAGNTGDGTMSNVATDPVATETEDWTVTYTESVGAVTPGGGNMGDGTVVNIDVKQPNAPTETWTLTCVTDPTPINGDEIFSVESDVVGPGIYPHATVNIPYDQDPISFEIASGVNPYVVGDTFTFTTTAEWQVVGTVSGIQTNTAITDILYTSPGGEVSFMINSGSQLFAVGDLFTFSTTAASAPYWNVVGTVSGPQTNVAYNDISYSSDNNEVTFTIAEGITPFVDGDEFEFNVAVSGTWGNGTVFDIKVKKPNAPVETWTLTCFDASTPGEEIFTVVSDVAGGYPNATVGSAYNEDAISFMIIPGSENFVVGDILTFTTTAYWRVVGTVSGVQLNNATTGAYYVSHGREVAFTITEDSLPFAIGDSFTFSTTGASAPFWIVEGTVSGIQSGIAQNNTVYTSDNYEVSFTIYEGGIAFATGDTFTFHVTASGLGHGWTVWDIVKIPDTHGPTAILYAATATGVFKSTNGGQTWDEPGSFTGDSITTISLHPISAVPGNDDVIYAGTLNAGVWVSTDSGVNWTQYSSGMELGQSATIKDLLLDPMNDRLYAITYQGPSDQAAGNVYVHALNADGSMATGQWSEVNTGLAGVGLHAMASDDPLDPGALFVGGEGINLYKATSGLATGAPAWEESKSGLANLIMARMPILFSGECIMTAEQVRDADTVHFEVYIEDENGNPPIGGSTFRAGRKYFEWDHVNQEWIEYIDTVFDVTYPDSYTYTGTFSDPGNASTDRPYTFSVPIAGEGATVTLDFVPANTLPDAPGSSGAEQRLIYQY